MKTPTINFTDYYKTDHRRQFPEGITSCYSNFTARGSRLPGIDSVIFFGLQYFIKKYLIEEFNNTFFSVSIEEAASKYKRRLDTSLGPNAVPVDHIRELHQLGYLPLVIKALPEGMSVPTQVPLFTIENTNNKFAWLVNFIETMISATVWPMCTSATIAREYRKVFEKYTKITGADPAFIQWQGHDFSFRGMFGVEAAMMSGAGHLLSFTGTDTIPAIDFLEEYYNANAETELIGGSVSATEHAVMCAGGNSEEQELATYKRLLTEIYPSGIVSIVSDTWDFWRVVTDLLPKVKEVILNRNGKTVIRPDSGDPVKIICGDSKAIEGSPENLGLVQCLWNIFGGTTTEKGFKVLDSHIGAIYGDSITLIRQEEILSQLAAKGFASSNIVLGIGSFTYQYVTRDTFGFAMKATHCTVNGENREIFKQPKTDSNKNSHKGLLAVTEVDGKIICHQNVSRFLERSIKGNMLAPVFYDGSLIINHALVDIRERINKGL